MTAGLSVHVFDAGGVVLGSFAGFDEAHRFAHDTAVTPGARVPLEVDDRRERVTWFVAPGRCEAVRWMAVGRASSCGLLPLSVCGPSPVRVLR